MIQIQACKEFCGKKNDKICVVEFPLLLVLVELGQDSHHVSTIYLSFLILPFPHLFRTTSIWERP